MLFLFCSGVVCVVLSCVLLCRVVWWCLAFARCVFSIGLRCVVVGVFRVVLWCVGLSVLCCLVLSYVGSCLCLDCVGLCCVVLRCCVVCCCVVCCVVLCRVAVCCVVVWRVVL